MNRLRVFIIMLCCFIYTHAAWAEFFNESLIQPIAFDDLQIAEANSSKISSDDSSSYVSRIPFFSWAWDLPYNLFDHYPVTKNSYWSAASCPTSAGVRFVHLRSYDNSDDFHVGGYASLRPFAFYFDDSLLIVGIYGGFDTTWNEGRYSLDLNNMSDVVSTSSIPFSVGLSMMWSLPRYGLQLEVEVGHSWNRMRSTSNKFDFMIPEAPGIPFQGRLVRYQEETGLSLFFGASLVSERQFLTGVELSLSGGFRLGHAKTKTSITKIEPNLLPGNIEIDTSPTATDLFIGLLYIKALSLDVTDSLPSFLQNNRQFVVFEPAVGASYLGWHHGYGIVTGVRLNLIESIGFSYFHSFKQNTSAQDVDVFRIEIGFEIGGRLTSLRA